MADNRKAAASTCAQAAGRQAPHLRPRCAALSGILFVLRTGIAWEDLPPELGCGSGVTCWRRLRDWQEAGVWDSLQQELLRRLRSANRIDFSRVCVDSSSIPAKKGGLPRAQIQRIAASRGPNGTL